MAQPLYLELKVYKSAEVIADAVYGAVRHWESADQEAVGLRLVRALDGIGAGIAAGYARGMNKDDRRVIRAALYEAHYWLRRAAKRHLLTEDQIGQLQPAVEDLASRLHSFLKRAARTKHGDAGDTMS